MIFALQDIAVPLFFNCERTCAMPADIKESAENVILSSNDDDRIFGDCPQNVIARLLNLRNTANVLPRRRENGLIVNVMKLWIGVTP